MPATVESIRAKIETAKAELGEAQRALDDLLRSMAVASETETTPVTTAVEEAFDRIRAAQAHLLELDGLLVKRAE